MSNVMGIGPNRESDFFVLGDELRVRRLGFGSMRLTGAGIWGEPADHDEAIAVLHRAVDLGVNLIDSADSYGPEVAERLIAEALHPYPEGLVIATKGGLVRPAPGRWEPNGRPEHLRAALEGSLKRLKLDRIDLYQFHRPDPKVPFEESVGTLKEMQDEGKIRLVGLSNVDMDQLQRARKIVDVAAVQNRYSLVDRESDPIVDYCEQEGIGFIPWFPLAVGDLAKPGGDLDIVARRLNATPSQVALAWLLQRSRTMLPIPGTSKVSHLEENMGAEQLDLTSQDGKSLAA